MTGDALSIELGFRRPYQWDAILGFLGARAISGVEAIEGSSYRRIVRLAREGRHHAGWIEVEGPRRKAALRVTLAPSLKKVMPEIVSRLEHLMDLACDPAEVAAVLGPLAAENPGLRLPGAFDGFEVAVRAILGQQVAVAAARTLAGRFAAAFGVGVRSPFAALSTAFPSPQRIARLDSAEIARLGVLVSRARAIIELARAFAGGRLALAPGVEVAAELDKLRELPGIGEWTAQYIAMRALRWPDAFPHTDLGVMRALGEDNPRRVLAAGDAWRPWRAYAVMHLWAGAKPMSRGPRRAGGIRGNA